MIWVAVILGMILAVLCIVTVTFGYLKALEETRRASQLFISAHKMTLETLERTHQRNTDQNSSVLDRFMALDFSLFKAYQSTEDAPEGGFEAPDDEFEGQVLTFTPSGREVRVGASVEERLAASINEAQLLREDFGEEFWQREDAR